MCGAAFKGGAGGGSGGAGGEADEASTGARTDPSIALVALHAKVAVRDTEIRPLLAPSIVCSGSSRLWIRAAATAAPAHRPRLPPHAA
ncbi:hypothetical protein [Sorangium sp. So ce233]|uniref:hypothetical protein n=1 Tax=Sorangium sp. So ce233 TaxID=3133290 RepID=UPI003F5E2059